MPHSPETVFQIGITLLPGIGPVTARKLISYCGGAEAVFRERKDNFRKIPGIGPVLAERINKQHVLDMAERELAFMEKYKVESHYYLDESYPFRLKHCIDSPVLFFYKGTASLEAARVLSIVGTRNATSYGREVCRRLVDGLREDGVLIVSGLAYGIDTCSHRYALEAGLETVGVLGHGLDRIYPAANKSLAEKMIRQGGLLSDFPSGTKPDRENFPRRNRLIAGLADATIVVEAAEGGGALITADIANSYNREVFAVPGRWDDTYSLGCNSLIRTNRAALIQSAGDLKVMMGWVADKRAAPMPVSQLSLTLTPDEELLVRILQTDRNCDIDTLSLSSDLSEGRMAKALLSLELQGIIKALPGKRYIMAR